MQQSMRLSIAGVASSVFPSRGRRMAMAAPGTTLMKNSQRQLAVS